MSCNAPVSDVDNSAAPSSAGETHKNILTELHFVLYCEFTQWIV